MFFTSYDYCLRELKTKVTNFWHKMAVKVTTGQVSNGTISQNACIEEYYLYGKFHGFMKSAQSFGCATILLHLLVENIPVCFAS